MESRFVLGLLVLWLVVHAAQGRRGSRLGSTTGSFTLSSGSNRAGNDELDEENQALLGDSLDEMPLLHDQGTDLGEDAKRGVFVGSRMRAARKEEREKKA